MWEPRGGPSGEHRNELGASPPRRRDPPKVSRVVAGLTGAPWGQLLFHVGGSSRDDNSRKHFVGCGWLAGGGQEGHHGSTGAVWPQHGEDVPETALRLGPSKG